MCELAAYPSPYPTPDAAWIAKTPGAPFGTGGRPDGSFVVSLSTGASAPARRPAVLIVYASLGFAPYFTSSFIAGTSVPYAARQNGVAPAVFTPSRSKLYDMYQRCLLSRAFGSAPALSSCSIRSRYVVCCCSCAVGCGYRDFAAHCTLIVA